MGANVFANGREVSAKKSDNQSISAMPDVCLSPPSPPAGPIPIPYPNFSNASDTSDGTKTVQIAGGEVGMKNQSNYNTSKGDEAATRSLGMGVVTHTIQGKTQFAAWSSDVMFEGANAVRFMDMTTHNHGSDPANSQSMTASTGEPKVDVPPDTQCQELDEENQRARNEDVDPEYTGRFTLTSSALTSNGSTSFMNAVSSPKCLKNQNDAGYTGANKKKTMACTQEEYGSGSPRHSEVNNNMSRNHAEAKLIESVFSAAGSPTGPQSLGTLTMKTFHKDTAGNTDAMPCESCRPAICASIACGLDIKLCNNENQAVDPPCENGQPAPEAQWRALGLG
jgi:hypothetical protein